MQTCNLQATVSAISMLKFEVIGRDYFSIQTVYVLAVVQQNRVVFRSQMLDFNGAQGMLLLAGTTCSFSAVRKPGELSKRPAPPFPCPPVPSISPPAPQPQGGRWTSLGKRAAPGCAAEPQQRHGKARINKAAATPADKQVQGLQKHQAAAAEPLGRGESRGGARGSFPAACGVHLGASRSPPAPRSPPQPPQPHPAGCCRGPARPPPAPRSHPRPRSPPVPPHLRSVPGAARMPGP